METQPRNLELLRPFNLELAKVLTKNLSGPALDWAVATLQGYVCQFDDEVSGPWLVPQEGYLHDEKPLSAFRPSSSWAQGGPIIERGGISWHCGNKSSWHAYAYGSSESINGSTPLIAAMRCYVASKLGEEVEVPDELV